MFILVATCAAVVCAVIEILFGMEKRSVSKCAVAVVKNIFVVDVLSLGVQRYLMKYKHFIDTSSYKTANFIKFFFVALIVGILFQTFVAVLHKRVTFERDLPPKKKGWAIAGNIVSILFYFLGKAAYTGTVWGRKEFGAVTGDQLLINLTSPTEGTEASVYIGGFEGPVFETVFATTIFAIILLTSFRVIYHFKNKDRQVFKDWMKRIICLVLACYTLYNGVSYGIQKFQLEQVFNAYVLKSDMIDSNFADPETTNIVWPEKKRNLVYIYLESMENSYLSKDLGGFMDENLMPNLTKVAQSGTVFSDTDNFFGGPQLGTGTQWSIASMVNQLSGLPMKAPGWKNTYGLDGEFLPGAYTLAELLEAQGYEQTMMFGASGTFGGLEYLFKTHANWKLMDYKYALKHKMIPEGYKVWWGYEDDKLFEFAKKEIKRLYKTGKPFNFEMETADTHRPDGYVTPGKETPYDLPYANAIWNSDKDVMEFLKWLQKQEFYENTTVILIGDHLSMDTAFFKDAGFTADYQRRQFNCIINADPSVANPDESVTRNRLWSNWDMYPTAVAAIGGKIEGERLGIGTNLYSGEPTIYEEYGVDYVNKELEKGSKLYTEKILQVENLKDAAVHQGR